MNPPELTDKAVARLHECADLLCYRAAERRAAGLPTTFAKMFYEMAVGELPGFTYNECVEAWMYLVRLGMVTKGGAL